MQSALTFEEQKQRSNISKQVVGLAAALLTGATITPMNMYAVQNASGLETNNVVETNQQSVSEQTSVNLRIMEMDSGSGNVNSVKVSNISLIDAQQQGIELRDKIVSSVLTWQGITYEWGGRTKAGVDCSGLVQRVFTEAGVHLPRTSYEQFRAGVGVPKAKLEPGDLVFFNTNGAGASHVGIYLGDRQFISATKNCVEIQSLDQPYWSKSYKGSRRVLT